MVQRLENGLELVDRVRLILVFERLESFGKQLAVDEWIVKEWVRGVVRKCIKVELGEKDLVKSNSGMGGMMWELYIWNYTAEVVRRNLIRSLDSAELIVAGIKLKCGARVADIDGFESLCASWEAVHGTNLSDKSSKAPDTLVIKGVPSRWFAEPRVSTEASVLVTHTVFSKFGKIRNLEIESHGEPGRGISSALQCQIWVQFERYSEFVSAVKALCGRSMQKDGSSFKANYVVDWDRNAFFSPSNMRKRRFEREHAQKLANDARLAQAQKLAEEKRRAEEAERVKQAEEKRRAEEAERAKQAEEARIAEALRRAEEERRAEEARKAAEQALREEEERRRKEEEDERLKQQLLEEQQRLVEEEKRRAEEAALKLVEEKNRQIREATRKLLQEQGERKKEEARQRRRQDEEKEEARNEQRKETVKRKAAGSPSDGDTGEQERWPLYLNEEGELWHCSVSLDHSKSSSSKKSRIRSIIVSKDL